MSRGWTGYFAVVACAAVGLVAAGLRGRAERSRLELAQAQAAIAKLNLAPVENTPQPARDPLPSQSESPAKLDDRLGATPDPRVPRAAPSQLSDSFNAGGRRGVVDQDDYFLNDPPAKQRNIPPEVQRLGDEAVAAYEDQRDAARQTAHEEFLRAYVLRDEDPKRALAMLRHVEAATARASVLR